MLQGTLDSWQRPQVTVAVRGPYGTASLDVVIDTAFTGAFSMPDGEIRRLGLHPRGARPLQAADGTVKPVPTFVCEVEWMNGWLSLEVVSSPLPVALIGAGLLRGHELIVNYGPAQSVEIR